MSKEGMAWRSWLQLVFGAGLTFLFFYMMAPFLVTILLGAVIAILCYPLYDRLCSRMPRPVSAGVVTAAVSFGLLVPLGLGITYGSYRLLGVVADVHIPRATDVQSFFTTPWFASATTFWGRYVPLKGQWFEDQLQQVVGALLAKISQLLGSFIAGFPAFVLAFFVVVISIYFFLVDGARFLRFLGGLSPLTRGRSVQLYQVFEKSCRGVVLGLLASSLLQGLIIFAFFGGLGMPEPLLMGFLGILMGMVPVIGTAPITVGAMIYLFATNRFGAGIAMTTGVVILSMVDNFVRAWILKGQSELHPLLALVSVFGAIQFLGAVGIFLGPVIAAVFVSFLRILSVEIQESE